MRILTVSAFYESHGGGIEVVAGELARALAARGHDSRWAAAAFDTPPSDLPTLPLEAADPIEHFTGLPMPLPSFAAARRLWQAVRDHDAAIVHDALYFPSLVALAAAKRWRRKCILIQHVGRIPFRSPLLKFAMVAADSFITRPLLGRVPQAVFISDTVRRQFQDASFRAQPALLFNGVDTARFHPAADKAERAALRQKLVIQGKTVLFVGRFVEKKGLQALRLIAERLPKTTFILAGSGPLNPADWQLPNLRIAGKLPPDELARLYRVADALVLPSVGEGYPLVVQEAMASGLPVVCGMDSAEADPGAVGFIEGVAVDPADPQGTATRFVECLNRLPEAPLHASAQYAAQTYNWAKNAARIEAMIQAM